MVIPALAAAALIGVVGVLATIQYVRLVRSTRQRQLRVNGLIRFGRSLRLGDQDDPGADRVAARRRGGTRDDADADGDDAQDGLLEGGAADALAVRRGEPDPVLLVHSLVTRPSVLDLAPGMSLVEALLRDGHDVWLLDWGTPGRAQAMATLSDYGRLFAAAEQQVRGDAQSDVHLVGGRHGCLPTQPHRDAGARPRR
ncbi:MAG: phaC [Frankiales bacterium]|nr:phaC [Frankiales bacterium]